MSSLAGPSKVHSEGRTIPDCHKQLSFGTDDESGFLDDNDADPTYDPETDLDLKGCLLPVNNQIVIHNMRLINYPFPKCFHYI